MARKAASAVPFRLVGAYERVRHELLDRPPTAALRRPLAYWVQPNDRRLPTALLDCEVAELLQQTLPELAATPGIGLKKLQGLLRLLERVGCPSPPAGPFGMGADPANQRDGDPQRVSEALWASWCESVRRAGLGSVLLGRVAPSLQSLPTVIWDAPLSTYTELTLAGVRKLRTHGEKHVQAIVEVFGELHEAVSTVSLGDHLELNLLPKFAARITRFLTQPPPEGGPVRCETLREGVVTPLVQQVGVDLGQPVAGLVAERLRTDLSAPTVRQLAERQGVTRARVYQLLDDCARAMEVRWPEGRWLLRASGGRLTDLTSEAQALLRITREVFFPDTPHRGGATLGGRSLSMAASEAG